MNAIRLKLILMYSVIVQYLIGPERSHIVLMWVKIPKLSP